MNKELAEYLIAEFEKYRRDQQIFTFMYEVHGFLKNIDLTQEEKHEAMIYIFNEKAPK